jgi:hypothetical protein
MRITLALNSHGEYGYGCYDTSFIVPEFVAFSFYYDPRDENAMICMSDTDVPIICDRLPPYIFRPGERCINLTLSRMDDISHKTGFYNCGTGLWLPIPGLEGVNNSVDPNSANISSTARTCLADIATFLNNNSVAERNAGQQITYFDIRVLACGITTKYKLNPTRQVYVNPLTGERMTREQFAIQQSIAYYNQLVPTMGDNAARAEAEKFYQRLLTGSARKSRRIRRKRIKTIRRKNKQ